MSDYPAPTLADEDIYVFLEWLSQKETIHKQAIELCINMVSSLQTDRSLLVRELTKLKFKEPDDV